MIVQMSRRMLATTDKRLLWKFAFNFGYKGMRSVQKFKSRIKRGEYFPPFLYISVINSCNLRCQGCWVKVDGPSNYLSADKMDRIINDAKKHGNSFFGILGGEPFMHPELMEILRRHPDCYFQIFTNGQFITEEKAAEMRKLGNCTPLISIEGNKVVSNERRGRLNVFDHSFRGLENCLKQRLITGVATSVCQSNIDDLVDEKWVDRLVEMGAHYVWFHTYRPVGDQPHAELALRPDQILRVRKFIVHLRNTKPIGVIDAYWDDQGKALCPMATGISHHINPWGEIEPCPIIQFAKETVHDERDLMHVFRDSEYLADFRKLAAQTTRGCIVMERPDLVKQLVLKHGARDTTHRDEGAGLAELEAMSSRNSQYDPANEIPEENWVYRFAKKHYFFGFGAYG